MTFFLLRGGLFAQQDTSHTVTSDPREVCLMATGADWARLGVDQDQILGINAVQSRCLEECTAAKAKGGDTRSVMDSHIAELRTVLNTEQFEQWSAWCAEKIGGPVQ